MNLGWQATDGLSDFFVAGDLHLVSILVAILEESLARLQLLRFLLILLTGSRIRTSGH